MGARLVSLPLLCSVLLLLLPRPVDAQLRELSLEELTGISTDIVVGSVESTTSRWNDARTRIYTEVRLRVADRLKGDEGDVVVVRVPGGMVGTTLYEVSDMPRFAEGEEVVTFLWKSPDTGNTLVTGAVQGVLRIREDAQGRRVLDPGAARLLRSLDAAGKAGPGAAPAPRGVRPEAVEDADARPLPVDELLSAIRLLQRR